MVLRQKTVNYMYIPVQILCVLGLVLHQGSYIYIYDYSPSNPDCPDPSNPVRTTWVVEAEHAYTHVEMKPQEE